MIRSCAAPAATSCPDVPSPAVHRISASPQARKSAQKNQPQIRARFPAQFLLHIGCGKNHLRKKRGKNHRRIYGQNDIQRSPEGAVYPFSLPASDAAAEIKARTGCHTAEQIGDQAVEPAARADNCHGFHIDRPSQNRSIDHRIHVLKPSGQHERQKKSPDSPVILFYRKIQQFLMYRSPASSLASIISTCPPMVYSSSPSSISSVMASASRSLPCSSLLFQMKSDQKSFFKFQ